MDDLAALLSGHVSEEETVGFCRDLVRAPSENPPGDERLVADVAEKILSGLGLPCERVEAEPGRISLVSSWGADQGGGDGPTLLFNGHYDVVPVPDPSVWPHPPFGAAIHDGRLYGRGSTDMKSGIAACLGAVSALQRSGLRPNGKLVMHLVADEEALGFQGAKYLLDNGWCAGIDEAVVGEPTAMHLVTSERGTLWFRVVTEGVSAHGSSPHLGVNAIAHMSRVVLALQSMRFRKMHEMLGGPTVNVGTIVGGSKVNMVPDRCVVEVDRRTIPGETQEAVEAEIREVLEGLRADEPDLKARLEVENWADAAETPPGMQMTTLLAEARDAFGIEGSELGYGGTTDARYLINDAGIPSVIFGPGDLFLAHTVGEYVELAQLTQATQVYAHAFARFLKAG